MADRSHGVVVNLSKVEDEATQRNFVAIQTALQSLAAVCGGKMTGSVSLASGDNSVTPPVPRPRGRITVYQSAAADLFDKGQSGSLWVINASAPCTAIFLFF